MNISSSHYYTIKKFECYAHSGHMHKEIEIKNRLEFIFLGQNACSFRSDRLFFFSNQPTSHAQFTWSNPNEKPYGK